MKTAKDKRAKRARAKHLEALAGAQSHNQTVWSTVSYRHGNKSFVAHGTYNSLNLHQRLEDVDHDK